jgi:hypothetical protein
MALTVGVGTVLESREVLVVVTGLKKSLALSKAIEEGVNHLVGFFPFLIFSLWSVSLSAIVDTFCPPDALLGSHRR